MVTIKTESFCEYEVKKSKFIAHAVKIDEFEERLKEIKALHPKARHFVTASRYLNEHDQIVESSSDDKEPRGSSGVPTLKVLQGKNIINVAIITVRYFGGVKLGVGGLARAYSDAANLLVKEIDLVEYVKSFEKSIEIEYNMLNRLEYLIKNFNDIAIKNREFKDQKVELTLFGKEESVNKVFGLLIRQ